MTIANRDFLEATPASPGPLTTPEMLALTQRQTDYLAQISSYLQRQSPDILCIPRVKNTNRDNQIADVNSHEVFFEVGGKPVTIYALLAWSTWTNNVGLSVVSMSKITDGMVMAANDVLNLQIAVSSMYVMAPDATAAAPMGVNSPSDAANGGFFLYGFTIPEWDKLRY